MVGLVGVVSDLTQMCMTSNTLADPVIGCPRTFCSILDQKQKHGHIFGVFVYYNVILSKKKYPGGKVRRKSF